MSIKAQLKLANFMGNFDFNKDTNVEKISPIEISFIQNEFGITVNGNDLYSVGKLTYLGKIYKTKKILNYGLDDEDVTLPLFGEIILIIKKNQCLFFILKSLITVTRDIHLDAFEVEYSTENVYNLLELNQIENTKPFIINQISNKKFINMY